MKILNGFRMLLLCLVASTPAFSQEFQLQYKWEGDSITLQITAPANGWLAVGFNTENNIIGSDLLQFAVNNGKIQAEDQLVTGPQVHPTDLSLGGQHNIHLLDFAEIPGQTAVRFRIPARSGDPMDFKHALNQPFWLITAYSVSDDFQHHSIQRKHLPFTWMEKQ